MDRIGFNNTSVRIANTNTRIICVLFPKNEDYHLSGWLKCNNNSHLTLNEVSKDNLKIAFRLACSTFEQTPVDGAYLDTEYPVNFVRS